MSRFQGIPVGASAPAASKGPRFQGTPVAAVGTPAAAPSAQPAVPSDYNESWLSQGLSGLNEGIALGLGAPVDLATGAINLATTGSNALLHTDIPQIEHPVGGSETFNALLGNAGTIRPESADPGKRFLRRMTKEVGSAALPIGGQVATAERPIAALLADLAGTMGSGAAAATSEQVAPNNPTAELVAELVGGATVGGVTRLARKAITPFSVSPERQAATEVLRQNGVDLTAGQQTGSKGLQYAESELGGGRIADINGQQAEQFTRAALQRAGVNAPRATQDVMNGAFTDIGHEFDSLSARNTIQPDAQLSTDLGAVVRDYNSLVPPTQRAPVINNVLGDLVTAIRQNGTVDGATYQALRSRLDRLARSSRNDPQLADALTGIRGALDDSMERSLAQNNPQDLGAWQDVRNRYRNLLVIEKAATGAGADNASGLISPAKLRQATISTHGRRSYARGNSDFADIAHAGEQMMTPLPNSGTAPRTWVRALTSTVPAALGAALGHGAGGIDGALAGAAAGAAVPSVVGRALLSQTGRRYLTNQLLPERARRAAVGPVSAALLNLSDNQRQPLQITVGP